MASTFSASPHGWFWSSNDVPPDAAKWVETGNAELVARQAPSSSRPARRQTPLGFWNGVSSVKVLFRRVDEPTAASPLTYCEYVYLLPKVTEGQARDFLLAQLVILQRELEAAPKGLLIRLAVCDACFAGRPGGLPMATLCWKDWVGEPVIGFPRTSPAPVSQRA